MRNVDLRLGDCRDILTELEDASVDSIVTDPPYELGFMGKKWDGSGIAFDVEMWEQCLRVLKPGGHLLAFGGSRTWHRLTVAIEDAGFEIRDSIAWLYGSGFPKSASIYKQTIKTLEERYGSARCDCLDPRDGQPDRDGIGRESWPAARTSREPGEVSANKAGAANVSVEQGGDLSGVRELWQSDTQEAEGSTAVEEPVLLAGVRERGAEEARHGHASVRGRLEDNSSQDSEQGRGLSVLREDTGGKRQSVACASPDPVQVRGDQPAGESGGPVRLVPSSDRGADQRGIGVDPGRSEPRRVISDSESGWPKADAKVCSWCGLPDTDWLASLEPLGTALKPAFEPIVVARKPLAGTVAANVLEHGTGALNIDACRVVTDAGEEYTSRETQGRWPTNVVLDEAQAADLDAQSGIQKSGTAVQRNGGGQKIFGGIAGGENSAGARPDAGYNDEGGASRFFPVFKYQAKAPTKERPSYVNEDGTKVAHSTVKPLTLMRWLARLVCPPGGVILDPFAGSGTTVEACLLEGFDCIAIENEADYIPLIEHRISRSTT
ncbi:DNA methyltransferase [Mycobacterium phage HanShotFirst]|uniref:DNA methyltransferase n=1 Tax=Mycobacterium phage HanShotFirst TaxID=1429904 RepID=UPI0003C9E260|nr:DNA methyltransferase [Mycobacterium phage HanShotFirst]AHB31837.1 DNA methyltransferase [Mycobacterium phage HanShotFirst]